MPRVLVIADPVLCVPPVHYGGAERIIAYLCDQLASGGWTVDLMAKPGSMQPSGRLLVHHKPQGNKLQRGLTKFKFWYHAWRSSRQADLVINFGRVDYTASILRYSNKPILYVFQNPAHQSEIDWILRRRQSNVRFIGVSRSQFQGIEPGQLVDVVHNVTDTGALTCQEKPDTPPYFAFLGRLTANKGVHLAIAAARQAGVRLRIAGTVAENEPGGREYFQTIVKPELHGMIEYIGPVNDQQKSALLQGATALLFPIQWNEPCALVLPESLSCGCPVIGWRNGCVPEIVRHSETGFVVNSIEEMIQAMSQVHTLSRSLCRRDAESRFSIQALGKNYSQVINRFLASAHKQPEKPAR